MTLLKTMRRGLQASVTLDEINLSNDYDSSRTGAGRGLIEFVNDARSSYEQIYRSQIWVRVCVDKLSRAIARLPLKTYRRVSDDERERVRTGWLAELMARPYEGCSPFHFKQSVVGNVYVHGNAVAVKVRNGVGRPVEEIIPSNWAFWRVQPGKDRPVDWYIFHGAGGQRLPFRPEEVVHWRWWAPGQGIVAPSPLEALKRTLIIEDAAQRTQIASYQNGVKNTGAFAVQGSLSDEQVNRMRGQLQETYGGVDQAYRVMVLEGGAKWESMSQSLADSEIINTRKLTREEAAALYDIPPPMIHILDRATFSNIDEQHRMLYQDTLGPPITMFEETLQTQLIDLEPTMRGEYVEFDLLEVMKGDPEKRFQAYAKAVGGPWMTADEARARENLPPKGQDELYAPANTAGGDGSRAEAEVEPLPMVAQARCPACDKLLAENIRGSVELFCSKCRMSLSVDTVQMV